MTRDDSHNPAGCTHPTRISRIKFLKALHERLEFQQTGVAKGVLHFEPPTSRIPTGAIDE